MTDVRLIDANSVYGKLQQLIAEYERRIPDYSANDVLGNGKKAARKWGNKADGIEKAISVINAAPTIEAEPDNGWISVKNRLPEIDKHYRSELVMCYSPDGEHEYLFDYYEMNGFGQGCFTAEKYFGITITHWRPLPKRPKGE